MGRRGAVACAVLAAVLCSAHIARAQDISFKGKTISIVVGYGVGGGYDLWGRLIAKYIGNYLPGKPTVIVQSMPGAGSLTAASYVYNVAPRDGTVLGVIGQTIPVDQLLNPQERVNIDSSKFTWLGRMAAGVETIAVWKTSRVQSVQEALRTPATIAAVGPSSGSAIYPTVLNNLLGAKFKVVSGYDGTKEMLMAMERGEADGCGAVDVTTLTSGFPQWLTEKKIKVITQVSLKRDEFFKDAPTFVELGRNQRQRSILRVFAASGDIGRALLAPPNLSPKLASILRTAFAQTMKDPDLLSFAKAHNIEVSPLEGADLQSLVASVSTTPKDIVMAAMAAMRRDD
jgi:tripartite-type tricarboxylate transporter receptor subunit TctC